MSTQTQKTYKIRKDDLVMVMTGKEKGKTGKVLSINPAKEKVLVESVNMVKRSQKPSQKMPQGGIVEKEAPLAISNVMMICGKCKVSVRVGKKLLKDGTKVRFCKKCGEVLDK
ncbi:LSU ribosomal protein L24p (L26e) [hydrothermal vent metagenome]|uniref:LSU ribosomal protein L24p (L26e) n=1 Tax=hydrothermal vent metagenome TaxID=652676 RepID=A0A3B0RJD4_9ZZZZ